VATMPDALRKSQPPPLGEENKSVTFFYCHLFLLVFLRPISSFNLFNKKIFFLFSSYLADSSRKLTWL
jgi:hypothetical protein